MKIRLTIMTENDKHLDVPKELLEQKTKEYWDMFFTMITESSNEKAIVEKCEVVEM